MKFHSSVVFWLLAASIPVGFGQGVGGGYHEARYPFKGVIKFDDGKSFQIAEIVVPWDPPVYVKDTI